MNWRTRSAAAVLDVVAVFWIAMFVYAVMHHERYFVNVPTVVVFYVLPVVLFSGLILVRWALSALRGKIALLTVTSMLCLFTGDAALQWIAQVTVSPIAHQQLLTVKRIQASESLGRFFDARTRQEVIRDLSAGGRSAFPAIHPTFFYSSHSSDSNVRRPVINGDAVIPLGSLSNSLTVCGNETGKHLVYTTDEHGFRNPRGLHRPGRVAICAVGDSFTQGTCETDIVGVLRTVYGESLNLGSGGNGPLCTLATLKEYAVPLRPPVVLWIYYEGNDLLDLPAELKDSYLKKYLDPTYSANLAQHQDAIDKALSAIVEQQLDESSGESDQQSHGRRLRIEKVLTLSHLRLAALRALSNGEPGTVGGTGAASETFEHLARVLRIAKGHVEAYGGKMYFVYLPEYDRFRAGRYPSQDCDRVKKIVAEFGIEFIDITESFNKHSDPLSLFPFRIYGHYADEGYQIVGQTILDRLKNEQSLVAKRATTRR